MAPLGNQGIASCSGTGITIPECCCQACLEDQIRLYRPSILSGPSDVLEARRGESRTLAEVPRAAPDLPDLKAA